MNIKLSEIKETFATLFTSHRGADPNVMRISAIEDCGEGDLVFADRIEFMQLALERKASAVVASEKVCPETTGDTGVLISPNVKLAQALLKQKYADRNYANEGWPQIHNSSVIHETAELGPGVHIGPHAVLAKDTRIGANTKILAGAVIESGVTIGANCIIHPNATIGYNSRIGNNVEIGSGSVIGSEGFGFAQDEKRASHKIPQTGYVCIEDNVLIGAGNCIDRGAYGATTIGCGTKTDNLCHIAHNVQVGKDCLLTAMLCVAGSTEIGDRVITSGQTGILDHMKICDDAVFLHRAGVTKNITEPGAYAGLPTQPLAQYQKNLAHQRKLGDLSKRIKKLEQEIQELNTART